MIDLQTQGQQLIDTGTRFILRDDIGGVHNVTLEDGVAAGSPWYGFRFHGGPLDGKLLYCNGWDNDEGYTYFVEGTDDGYVFNSAEEHDEAVGHDVVPAYAGVTFFVEE